MEKNEIKLYTVSAKVDRESGKFKINESGVFTETAKSYVGNGRRIDKEKLLRIDSGWVRDDTFRVLYFQTECLESDLPKAREIVLSKMRDEWNKRCDDFELMKKNYFDIPEQ